MRVHDENHDSVDAALKHWRQGDCVVGEQWFVYRLSIAKPLTREAVEAANQGFENAEAEVRGFLVISQTCDIVRACIDRPYIEVSPLVEVDSKELQGIARGRRPRYAYIPGLQSLGLVGDLDRVMTVEKAVVANWQRISGCTTDHEMRVLAQSLARKRVRFAFPDEFTVFVKKLQDRLLDKHNKCSDEGEGLRALREIRVRAAPSWYDDPVDILFWFIRNDDEPNFKGQFWHKLLDKWLELVPATPRFKPVSGVVTTLDDMTARDYVESDPLDLDHLSFR